MLDYMKFKQRQILQVAQPHRYIIPMSNIR